MPADLEPDTPPPCPQCAGIATVLYANRQPPYVRCNVCGHVWKVAAGR